MQVRRKERREGDAEREEDEEGKRGRDEANLVMGMHMSH